jgi:hypothetical protein
MVRSGRFRAAPGIGEKRYFEFSSQATDALNHFNPGFPIQP